MHTWGCIHTRTHPTPHCSGGLPSCARFYQVKSAYEAERFSCGEKHPPDLAVHCEARRSITRSPMPLRLIGSERLLVCPISMLAKSLARNTPGAWPCPEMMIAVVRGRAWPSNTCSGGTDEAFLPLANAVELIPGQRDRQTKGEGAPALAAAGMVVGTRPFSTCSGGTDEAFMLLVSAEEPVPGPARLEDECRRESGTVGDRNKENLRKQRGILDLYRKENHPFDRTNGRS